MDIQQAVNRHISHNKRLAACLAIVFVAGVFIPVFLVLLLISRTALAVFPALVVALVWSFVAWRRSDAVVLDLAGARDANVESDARLFNVVNGLRAAMGLPSLDLYLVDEDAMNAFSTGRDPNHASLVLTTGLIERLDFIELEAVIALELFKIKTHETLPQSFVVPTYGVSLVLAEAADSMPWLANFLRLPTPWVDAILAKVSSSQRDLERDVEATAYTRYPPALADALEKISGKSALGVAAPVTAHLWVAPATAPSANPSTSKLHAPIADRVAVLQEL